VCCSGVYNCVSGPLKAQIPLVHLCAVISNATYEWDSHSSLPAIRSIKCKREGVQKSPDGGLQCLICYNVKKARGNSNPREFVKKFFLVFQKAVERRTKAELTPSDIVDAKWWKQQTLSRFTTEGKQLYYEAMSQLQYTSTVSSLINRLKIDRSIKVVTAGAIISPRQFMEHFTDHE